MSWTVALKAVTVAALLCFSVGANAQASGIGAGPSAHGSVPTVVIVLSPRMVNALKEWPRMRRAAEREGYSVVSFRDPAIGDHEWRSAALAANRPEALALPALADPAIEPLGVFNHSPTSVVRIGSQVHPWPILGVMPDAAWLAVLRHRVDQFRVRR